MKRPCVSLLAPDLGLSDGSGWEPAYLAGCTGPLTHKPADINIPTRKRWSFALVRLAPKGGRLIMMSLTNAGNDIFLRLANGKDTGIRVSC